MRNNKKHLLINYTGRRHHLVDLLLEQDILCESQIKDYEQKSRSFYGELDSALLMLSVDSRMSFYFEVVSHHSRILICTRNGEEIGLRYILGIPPLKYPENNVVRLSRSKSLFNNSVNHWKFRFGRAFSIKFDRKSSRYFNIAPVFGQIS